MLGELLRLSENGNVFEGETHGFELKSQKKSPWRSTQPRRQRSAIKTLIQ